MSHSPTRIDNVDDKDTYSYDNNNDTNDYNDNKLCPLMGTTYPCFAQYLP